MDDAQTSLLLKRPVTIKVIVTPRWKEEAQQQLQAQMAQIDAQIQQLETQGQRAIAEIQRQSLIPLPPRLPNRLTIFKSKSINRKVSFSNKKTSICNNCNRYNSWNSIKKSPKHN